MVAGHREAEVAHQEAEVAVRRTRGGSSTRQPAGKQETTVMAVVAAGTVMATGNAVMPPSRNLATAIMTMPANINAVGDGVVGAVGIVSDRDGIGGGCEPGAFDKVDALVLTAEAMMALVVDDAIGNNGGIAVVCGIFEDAVVRSSGAGTTTMGNGGRNYAFPAGAISMTMAATHWARHDAFDTATTAAADKR